MTDQSKNHIPEAIPGRFTVVISQTLFCDWHITLTSNNLDYPVIGSAFFFNNAKIKLERALSRTARLELRKLITVYKYSKYEFDPLEGRETLEKLEQLLSSFNAKTKLLRLQQLLMANQTTLEQVLPTKRARSYPSQRMKVNFLVDLTAFDMDSIQEPSNRSISSPKSTDYDR